MSRQRKHWPLSAAQAALVRALMQQCACDFYMVGGYVRDVLMGTAQGADLDLVYGPGATRPCQDVARGLGWHTFVLDADRDHWRFLWRQGATQTETVDIAPMQGGSIAQDLSLRDCTVNAMAVAIAATDATGAIGSLQDPQRGQTDLANAVLRPVSLANLRADPLRMLRLVRLAHTHRLQLQGEALAFLKTAHAALDAASGERIREEGWRLLLHGRSPLSRGVGLLHETRLYAATFFQPGPLHADSTGNPLRGEARSFVDGMGGLAAGGGSGEVGDFPPLPSPTLSADTQFRLGRAANRPLAAEYTRRHWWARLSLLALPLLMRGGLWSAYGQFHADTLQNVLPLYWPAVEGHLRRLVFSRAEVKHSLGVLRCLSRLLAALRTGRLRLMRQRALHRFIVGSGYTHDVSVVLDAVLILSQALKGQDAGSGWAAGYRDWQTEALIMLDRTGFRRPRPLVSGIELQNWFGVAPGPRVGHLLGQVVEAEACREISTPCEAKRYIAELL